MMLLLLAAAALPLAHLARTRALRERRRHLAREARRDARERQWRAMILDGDGGDRAI